MPSMDVPIEVGGRDVPSDNAAKPRQFPGSRLGILCVEQAMPRREVVRRDSGMALPEDCGPCIWLA
jgi:hypothetical protein